MSILRDNVNRGPKELRRLIKSSLVVAPGVFNGISAILAEKAGSKALYLSGSGVAGAMGLPDLSVTTLSELAVKVSEITSVTESPLIVDVDTGFGEVLNVVRTVRMMEAAGASAIHIEDQVLPKKCGHLPGKMVIPADEMVLKVKAAVKARKNKDFMIIARTDARAVEGLGSAIDRAKKYLKAGADAIFSEALEDVSEFEEFAKEIKAPLLANMTEFGKSPLLSSKELEKIGYKILIFPLTAFRASLLTMEHVYKELNVEGTQRGIMDQLMTRKDFYKYIGYEEYEKEDADMFNSKR
ncbi:MAG: methylisocitrate lyase [Candidatus Micrarchaeaceae archaeon]